MPAKPFHPSEWLGVAEILAALGIDCDGAEKPEHYLAIPGNSGPRWLIPARSQASAAVLSSWRPYSFSGRAKWLAIQMAARAGLLQLASSVSSVAISRVGSLRWFERCAVRSRTGEMVILVGNPSSSRKLIVFLLDDAHRIAAVLKIGVTAGGGASILHEAEVLGKLEGFSWAPKILSVHPDLRAAAQGYVHGGLAGRSFRPEYLNLLCQLPRSGSSLNLADLAGTVAKTLNPFKAELDKIAPYILSRSLASLDLDFDLPTLLVHGDFVPWNIRITPDSSCVLIDWEFADFAGLPGFDLFHFQFSNDRLFGSKRGSYSAIRASSACAQYLRRMDLDAKLLPRLVIAYLLDQLVAGFNHRGIEDATYTLRQLAELLDALGN
jgi:hypothetical protein